MVELSNREKEILKLVCLESLKREGFIGSKLIAKKLKYKYSSATIRNIFSSLEKKGLLYKAHFSSGRLPTDFGWRYFVDEFVRKEKLGKEKNVNLEVGIRKNVNELEIVKRLAQLSGNLALMFSFLNKTLEFFYQVGISQLFSNIPEGNDLEKVAQDLDRFVQFFPQWVFDKLNNGEWPMVLIGKECDLIKSGSLSVLIENLKKGKKEIFLLLVGPKKMSYQKNIYILEEVSELMEKYGF